MIVAKWNTQYEGQPSNQLPRSLVDDEIRGIARNIRGMMENEHYWGGSDDSLEGKHNPGLVGVCTKGPIASAPVPATYDLDDGCLYLADDSSLYELYAIVSGVWTRISTLDHQELDGRDDDDHSQYIMFKDGTYSTYTLDMQGNLLISPAGSSNKFKQFLLFNHSALSHPTLGNILAVKANVIRVGKIKWSEYDSGVLNISTGSNYNLALPGTYRTWPQVLVSASYTSGKMGWTFASFNDASKNFTIFNDTGSSFNFRVRCKYI